MRLYFVPSVCVYVQCQSPASEGGAYAEATPGSSYASSLDDSTSSSDDHGWEVGSADLRWGVLDEQDLAQPCCDRKYVEVQNHVCVCRSAIQVLSASMTFCTAGSLCNLACSHVFVVVVCCCLPVSLCVSPIGAACAGAV